MAALLGNSWTVHRFLVTLSCFGDSELAGQSIVRLLPVNTLLHRFRRAVLCYQMVPANKANNNFPTCKWNDWAVASFPARNSELLSQKSLDIKDE